MIKIIPIMDNLNREETCKKYSKSQNVSTAILLRAIECTTRLDPNIIGLIKLCFATLCRKSTAITFLKGIVLVSLKR